LHRPPRWLHALLLEHVQRAVHVIHLEGEALPAEPLLCATRRDGFRLRIAHHLDGGAAKLEVHEIQWPGRSFGNAPALALAEAEHADIEADRALGRGGEQLDM